MSFKVEKQFEMNGLLAVVTLCDRGYRCGYVGLPPGHPLHGVSYMDEHQTLVNENGRQSLLDALRCHGGLTYSGKEGYPLPNPGLWWLGFDCDHYMDGRDVDLMSDEQRAIYLKCHSAVPKYEHDVRSTEYVVSELVGLCEQISAVFP